MVEKQKVLENARRKFHKKLNTQGLPELLEENFRHPIWEELMHECLACGSCTMVCPTCFCYNVVDKIDLNLKSGKRQREWDSCMLLEYAQVALGHNFRKDRDARVKQRIYHKLVYYEPQFGTLGCVGCGRCIKTCVKKIDITDVISRLRGE
jgi:heterodisulfide reductase subunit C